MKENTDKRVIKTKRAIKNSFFELMNEIGFSKINITTLIKRAEINRNTFYTHYIDKYDLLEKIEEELLMEFKEIIEESPIEKSMEIGFVDIQNMIYYNHLMNFIHENGVIFTLLLSDKGDPAFSNKLKEILKSIWTEKKIFDKVSIPQEYILAAEIGILTSLIEEWVKNGFRETPQDFGNIVLTMIRDIPNNLVEDNGNKS